MTKQQTTLQPWLDQKLMGVDGSPLQMHGQVRAVMVVQGHTLGMEALAVSPLTTEGILGLDTLKQHEATIWIRVSNSNLQSLLRCVSSLELQSQIRLHITHSVMVL